MTYIFFFNHLHYLVGFPKSVYQGRVWEHVGADN